MSTLFAHGVSVQAQSQRPSAESLTLKGEIPVAAIKSVRATVSEEPEGDHLLTLDTSIVRCFPPLTSSMLEVSE